MKACPKCKTNNRDSSHFCKKCGSKLSGSQFLDKKEMVLGGKKKISRVTASMALVAIILGGIAYWIIQDETTGYSGASVPPRSAGASYAGRKISMTDFSPAVENGKIIVPLHLVLSKRLVRFEHESNGEKIPLLSYITQVGRVVTAVSLCESCRSTRFHIDGNTLVCNACSTAWNLETLKGISGRSVNYPPDIISAAVDNCCIKIDEKTVAQWKPRV